MHRRCRDTEQRQGISQDAARRVTDVETRRREARVIADDVTLGIELVELACEARRVMRKSERGKVTRASCDELAKLVDAACKSKLCLMRKRREVGIGWDKGCGDGIGVCSGCVCILDTSGLAQDRTYACMSILNIVDGIGRILLLGLLDIEVNCLVG